MDITDVLPSVVESNFKQFLARERMVAFGPIIKEARELHRELEDYQKFKNNLTGAWNELAGDKHTLADLILGFCEIKGIQASPENVERFLGEPRYGHLVNEVPKKAIPQKKPASFQLPASPTKVKKVGRRTKKPKGWKNFLLELCELMQRRHPEHFHQTLISMPVWFSDRKDSKFSIQIGNESIYTKWVSAQEFRVACYEVVTEFGYPKDSLVIKDSEGATL